MIDMQLPPIPFAVWLETVFVDPVWPLKIASPFRRDRNEVP